MPRIITQGGGGRRKPPVVEQLSQPAHPINTRASALPTSFVQENPLTATRLVLSNVPNSVLKQFGQGLAQNYEWMKSVSGPGGMFMVARAHAYSIADPELRKAVLGTVDALQSVSEQEQQRQDQLAQPGIHYATARAANQPFIYDSPTVAGLHIEVRPADRTITLPTDSTQNPVYQAAASVIKQLYPDWKIETVPLDAFKRFYSDVLNTAVGAIGKGLDAPFQAADWLLTHPPHVPGTQIGLRAGQKVTSPLKPLEQAANIVTGRVEDLAAGAVEQTGYFLTGNFHQLPKDYYWPDAPGTALGNIVADSAGLKPTDPARQSVAQTADLVGQLLLLKGVGEFARGFKAGRTAVVPDEYGNIPGTGAAAVTGDMHLMEKIGFDLSSHTIEDWGQTSSIRRAVSKAREIVAGSDNPKAKLTRLFGHDTMTESLADALVHTQSDVEATAAWMRSLRGQPDVAQIEALKARRGAISTELRGDVRTSGREKFMQQYQTMDESHANATFDQVWKEQLATGTPGIETQPFEAGPRFVWRDDNGVPKGVFQVSTDAQGNVVNASLAVAREAQGAGVARSLIEEALNNNLDIATPLLEGRIEGLTRDSATLAYKLLKDKGLLPQEFTLPGNRLSSLKAEQGEIEAKLSKLADKTVREPPIKLPTWAKLKKVGISRGPVGDTLRLLSNPGVRWLPHLSRLFDRLGQTTLFDPFGLDRPTDFARRNEQTVRDYLTGSGVKQDTIDAVVEQLQNVTSSEDFNQVMRRIGRIYEEGDARFIAADQRLAMSRIMQESNPNTFLRSQIERTHPDGSKSYEGVLSKDVPAGRYDLPSDESELIGNFHLPSVNRLIEGRSLTQQMVRAMRKGGPIGATAATALDTVWFISKLVTTVSKVAILAPRVWLGALFTRIQGEQVFREKMWGVDVFSQDFKARHHLMRDTKTKTFNSATEGTVRQQVNDWLSVHNPFVNNLLYEPDPFTVTRGADGSATATVTIHRSDVALERKFKQAAPGESLGLITFRESPFATPSVKDWRPQKTIDPVNQTISDDGGRAILARISQASTAASVRKLVELQGNVDAWVKWLNNDPYGLQVKRTFGPILDQANLGDVTGNARFKEWGKRKWESIQQLTGGNDGLLEMIRDGTWTQRESAYPLIKDPELAVRYQHGLDDITRIRSAIDDAFYAGDHAQITALAAERLRVISSLEHLEREAGITPGQLEVQLRTPQGPKARKLSIAQEEEFIGRLRMAHTAGEYTPPEELNHLVMRQPDSTGTSFAERMRNWNGDHLYSLLGQMTKRDLKYTRGSLFSKLGVKEYTRLKGLGYTDENAFAWAKAYAARMTSDIMYDLSERTSAQRALRNIFWFGPAWQELVTTWGIKIPSRYYWPIGASLLYEQAHTILALTKSLGLIQTNQDGKDVIVVPGLGPLLGKLTGAKVPGEQVYGYPSGLSILGGWPGVSIQGQTSIDWLAQHTDSHIMNSIDNAIHQFSPATRSVPASITYFYEAVTGKPAPFEFLHQDYQQELVDMGWDQAVAQARVGLGVPPNQKNYPPTAAGEKSYIAASQKYQTALFDKARGTYRAWSALFLFGATVSPMSLHVTDQYRKDASKYYNSLGNAASPASVSKAQQTWLDAHPNGIGYITGKSFLTGKGAPAPYTNNNQQAYYQDIYNGARKVFPPAEYTTWLMGMESRRVMVGKLQQTLDAIGTNPQDLLTHRYQYFAALQQLNDSWDQYLMWNDTPGPNGGRSFASMWDERNAIYQKLGFKPYQDVEVDRINRTLDLMGELGKHFMTNGIPLSDYKTVVGKLAEIRREQTKDQALGYKLSPIEQGLAWYRDKVYVPYLNGLQPLYAQVDALTSQGKDASAVYEEIRRYQEKFTRMADSGKIVGPDGKPYPDPQLVIWGNKSPAEQRELTINYATKPVGWLTSFQRKQAGYDRSFNVPSDQVSRFFSYQAWLDGWVQKYEDAHGISKQSTYGQQIQSWRDSSLRALALGKGGAVNKQEHIQGSPALGHLFGLSEGPPIGRLVALGYGNGQPGSDTFHRIAGYADYAAQAITNAGMSPSGDSAYAIQVKQWFYNAVDTARQKDPGFDQLMKNVSLAMPSGKTYREGPLLYQALYFDNFNSKVASVYYAAGKGTGPYNVVKWQRTYSNGRIPYSAMTDIGRGMYLQPAAANAFQAAELAAQKQGINLVSGINNTYRSYAEQASPSIQNSPYGAAAPGSSNHGWGLAMDINVGTKAWTWMVNNGARYGWLHDVSGDPVHFDFRLTPGA